MTHINAYISAVESAKNRVSLAKGELEEAKLQLANKKSELGLGPEPTTDGEDQEDSVKEKLDRRKAKK